MKFLNKILVLISALSLSGFVLAITQTGTVQYNTGEVLATITNMTNVGIAVAGGFITLAITMMFYKTVRRFVAGRS